MAFTSGVRHGGSDAGHSVELQIHDHTRNLQLPDLPGDDYLSNKGDLWKLDISDFHFTESCITLSDIKRVSIIERSNGGWHIESIATFVLDTINNAQILTQDLDVNKWIDGDNLASWRRLELTKA